MRARFWSKGSIITYYKHSSLWSGLRSMIPSVELHARWLLGDGTTINFWRDRWLTSPIVDMIDIPEDVK
ncbi:hypothetical protein BVC80_1323g13 [Macleaya cordata]|uniref:Reverse transcriptase zinc-binding domain n=1 Tax=Macleaya cordata TaxID=56857 RepID=A0A200Q062_MACCD|nr:hypothetical protein BVC80_1323g13 [Macleaya cordata]